MASSNSGTLLKCHFLPPAPGLIEGLAGQAACKTDLRDASHHGDGQSSCLLAQKCTRALQPDLEQGRGWHEPGLALGKGWGSCTGWNVPWPLELRSPRKGDSTKHPRFWLGGPQCECWGCFCSLGQQWCKEIPAWRCYSSTHKDFISEAKLLAERAVRRHLCINSAARQSL